MKKLTKYHGYSLFSILALVLTQSSASAANSKSPNGSLNRMHRLPEVFWFC